MSHQPEVPRKYKKVIRKLARNPNALREECHVRFRVKILEVAITDARFRREVLNDLTKELLNRATSLTRGS